MKKNDFRFIQDLKHYEIVVDGLSISINEDEMSDETIGLAKTILSEYPQKIDAIAEYLSKDDGIQVCYDNPSKDELVIKLHEPVIRVDTNGGVLSYCNHELDDEHIIDLEFGGAFEDFYYVSIDG